MKRILFGAACCALAIGSRGALGARARRQRPLPKRRRRPRQGADRRQGTQGRASHADRTADRLHGDHRAGRHDRRRVDVRGGAPGTRETDLLSPVNNVQIVNAITLSGGSAYGLDAAQGVMRYLEEQNIGYKVGPGVVPIVPAAILFDLGFGGDWKIRPTADCGYKAAQSACDGPVAEGNVGAGAGATVGKMGQNRSMKGGLGSASITLPDGLVVAALVAVNAVGDVIDPATGAVVAGVRTEDGKGLADVRTAAAIRRPAAAGAARRGRREHHHRASSPPTPS